MIALLIQVLIASLPYYFFSRWLERKMKPRQSGRRLLAWFLLILLSAVAYFLLAGSLYLYWISPRLFGK